MKKCLGSISLSLSNDVFQIIFRVRSQKKTYQEMFWLRQMICFAFCLNLSKGWSVMRLRFKIDQGQFFCQIIFSQIILKRKPEENLPRNVLAETLEEGEGVPVEA